MKTIVIIISTCLCSVFFAFSQEVERYVEIRGRAELDMKPLNGATAKLYDGNSVIKTARTGSDGMFSFKLDVNKYYVVEVGKSRYISKRLAFDTSLPDEVSGVWVREFAISVVKNCEGVDYSALKDPIDVIKYDEKRKDFESDRAYLAKMRSKLQNIMIANENCVSDKYSQLLKEADRLFKQKAYDEAKEKYAAASELFQDEEYPKSRLEEINQQQSRQENIEDLYRRTIGEAEALMAQNKPEEALLKYKGAMTLKPQESLPRQKVSEIETLLAKSQAAQQEAATQEARYNSILTSANTEMANKNYEGAKALYQSALQLRPGDQTVTLKISQLDNLMAEQAKNLANQKAADDAYNTAIAQAEQAYAAKNYEVARQLFQKAATFKPANPYPGTKIAEIDRVVQAEKLSADRARAAQTERLFRAAVDQADNLFRNEDFQGAIEAYNRALTLKPDELYPKQQIAKINNTIAAEEARKQREINAGYQTALAAAERSVAAKDYQAAKGYYQQALQFKPNDEALQAKIAEMERLIAMEVQKKQQQEEIQQRYLVVIQKADQLFASRNMDAAKTAYQEALGIKPDEQYPQQRIQEIDRQMLAEQSRKQQQMTEGYQNAVNAGNAMLAQKQYQSAKESFQKALTFKPDDVFAKNKLLEIDNLIRQEQARLAANQAKRKQYDELIARADGLYNLKNYAESKTDYQRALQMMPDQTYPVQRIAEIDRLLAEQQRILAEQQAKDNAYRLSVNKADNLFNQKQYELAKSEYNNALSIKPSEVYPKNRITEIDNLVAQQLQNRAMEENYKNSLAEADRLFAEKNYTAAKTAYNRALGFKPNEVYPKTQISKIDNLIAEADRLRQQELARQQQYDSYISQADKLFTAKDYIKAKELYQQALSIKPDEQHPQLRIARINEIYALLAEQQKKQSGTASGSAQKSTTQSGKMVPAELNFKNDSERDRYLAGLKSAYPEGVTAEVYKEQYKVTTRYVIIRGNEIREFREIHFLTYGGKQYSMNGKPITEMYFDSQVKPRSGEYYKKFEY